MDAGPRIILHVDMDAFYASVEARERPELANHPLVIGADPRGGKGRGVVSTANYHARRFGIHSAMPISRAYAACPEAVFLPPDFKKYKPASRDVMEVLGDYADVLEVVGMDEAYLDITDACNGSWANVARFCRSLQAAVKRRTGLSCSVGAAPTKSVAKIASDRKKPHGVTVVDPPQLPQFLDPLPVRVINGCGPKTAESLREQGFRTIGELARADPEYMQGRFGKSGAWLWNVANGKDPRTVSASRGASKSRGNERTYGRDTRDASAVEAHALQLLEGLLGGRDRRPFATVTVKVRYHDFTTLTRAHSLSIPINPDNPESAALASATASALLRPLLDGRAVRLVGVRLSSFSEPNGQRSLTNFGLLASGKRRVPELDRVLVAPQDGAANGRRVHSFGQIHAE